ncbi:MAG: NAD-dependent epimerase/dehydratase family protein [Candidatus Bathyarchaeota archaeon]|nr:NAD-dependent epimerase/dehydratase family protein [Candidatus Bathyarchaeota archaeon]
MSKTVNFQKIFITGGAGFMGSHVVDRLCQEGKEVVVFDNLSSGKLENIRQWLRKSNFNFVREDLLKPASILEPLSECEIVFHLAANPEVRVGAADPKVHYEQNIATTFNLLEAIRKVGCVKSFVFTSSSTVYGDAEKIPTPEDYAPLKPVSIYGASKLASEALITAYAYTYGFKAIIYRLANIIGPRSQHGVIYDFVNKLSVNSKKLEILGDGAQRKSYLYVDDCIEALLIGVSHSHNRVEIYNVGSEDQVNVKEIADIVCQEMGLRNVEYVYTGGVNGGRGWKGDVKVMLLNIEKIKSLGWKPKLNSCQAVERTVKALLRERKSIS